MEPIGISEYKYLFEVYDPNTKKDIYLEGDKMYEFLEKWR